MQKLNSKGAFQMQIYVILITQLDLLSKIYKQINICTTEGKTLK